MVSASAPNSLNCCSRDQQVRSCLDHWRKSAVWCLSRSCFDLRWRLGLQKSEMIASVVTSVVAGVVSFIAPPYATPSPKASTSTWFASRTTRRPPP